MIPTELDLVVRDANSMKIFAGEDPTVILGEWREWRQASILAGKWLDPEPFKKKKAERCLK